MKYKMVTKFWYDNDEAALVTRLSRLFQTDFFRDTVLRPRSERLPVSAKNLLHVLQPDDYQKSDVRFVVNRGKKSLRGTLDITRNALWTPPGFTSFLELSFSLSEGYKGGPFGDAYEVRDILLACVHVGPAPIGFVECEDESDEQHTAKFETFRRIDSMAVPVAIEWVTVLHKDVVARIDVPLLEAAANAGVLVGQQGDYWWIILTESVFSFTNDDCIEKYQAMNKALNLTEVHKRFGRARP
jgi:hypothetical protein